MNHDCLKIDTYRIDVLYTMQTQCNSKAVSQLFIYANQPDLALLLRILDQSPSVAQLKVTRTVTIPVLEPLITLTQSDLGIKGLSKLG